MSRKYTDTEAQELIEAAVNAACDACMKGIDEKLQAAIDLGVTVGAKIGAEIGASSAVRAIERERKRYRKQQRDRRYHNVRVLLKHYRQLNEHYEHAVFTAEKAEEELESFSEIMQRIETEADEALYIESIKQSCMRTKIIMAHVNKMLEIYRIMCETSKRQDAQRRWRVLYGMYLSTEERTAGALAQQEHIDRRTIYKDIDVCVNDLTALLWGIDGVDKL